MTKLIYYIKLLRPLNLLIIAATMYVVKFFVFQIWIDQEIEKQMKFSQKKFYDLIDHSLTFEIDFLLLVVSTVLLAAAGNIINDYFDIKADRVNRPDKIIIGKYIKRRWAIFSHWAFSTLGVIIAMYLGWKHQSYALVFIPIFSSFALWIYSVSYKRKLLIGNILIALLTALVVVLPSIFILHILPGKGSELWLEVGYKINISPAIFLSVLLAVFAFISNFTREIVKDYHDVDGDKKMACETIPIVTGDKFTRFIIGVLIFIQLLFFLLLIVVGSSKFDSSNFERAAYGFSIGLLITLLYTTAFIMNIASGERKNYNRISFVLKIIMLLGVLFPLIVLF